MRTWAWLAALTALLATPSLPTPASAQDLTLTGVLTRKDHQTYREVPFRVPAGVTAVTIDFSYTGRDQKAVIDLGLRDPQRFRGWSGGNKASLTLTETWATPSYLPGPLPAGTWRLILGVPNLREGATAAYTAKITFARDGVFHGFTAAPLKDGPGWYRGDLHLHTAHSDGGCPSHTGRPVPCPLVRTLDAALARGLDFVAVTDHNTPAQAQSLAELQPLYDDLLLIPGQEITTFHGHMNVLGVPAPLDFQLGGPRLPTLAPLLKDITARGGFTIANHPGLPSGEACMGCGWTMPGPAATDAVEVVNGAIAAGPLSGAAFWDARLNTGAHVTGVGGSDTHDPTRPPGVGVPTTVVRAEHLSNDAILAGLRAGHAFIDVEGSRDRLIEITASAGGRTAGMGDMLEPAAGATLTVHVASAVGGRLVFLGPAAKGLSADAPLTADDTRTFSLSADAQGWLRVEVRSPSGKPWLIANPVYLGR